MNNSRWKANRVGLIDFWYYDEEEFSFLDGRMLLRGSNGSGKSVTMQSFLPLILDGNMRPERLDPFGSRARKMENYLLEDVTHKVYVSKNKKGEYAETHYEVINRTNKNTLVRVNIKTGKKNQIRVAFLYLGMPIIGDKKYGSKTNPIKRLGLHAYKLKIKLNDKEYEFIAKLPKEFEKFQGMKL